MEQQKDSRKSYESTLHTLGRWSTAIVLAALISVPLLIGLVFSIRIDIPATGAVILGVISMFGVISAIEFVSYAPILGIGGQYLAFITGNIANMKLPAAINSVKVSGYAPGSKEAEIVSTIAIAISTLVTTAILAVGMIFLGSLLPVLQSPALTPAFTNMIPALLGALATPFFLKDYKTASVPMVLAAILTLILGYAVISQLQAFIMPVMLAVAIGWAYFLFKRKKKAQASLETKEINQ
jgi:hypothetical protein